jgi:hypothetical protein
MADQANSRFCSPPRSTAGPSRCLIHGDRLQHSRVPTYRLHETTGDDLGTVEHPAPNVEPGDVVVLEDGREALVTSRVETNGGHVVALLEVAIAPTPLTSDDSLI